MVRRRAFVDHAQNKFQVLVWFLQPHQKLAACLGALVGQEELCVRLKHMSEGGAAGGVKGCT